MFRGLQVLSPWTWEETKILEPTWRLWSKRKKTRSRTKNWSSSRLYSAKVTWKKWSRSMSICNSRCKIGAEVEAPRQLQGVCRPKATIISITGCIRLHLVGIWMTWTLTQRVGSSRSCEKDRLWSVIRRTFTQLVRTLLAHLQGSRWNRLVTSQVRDRDWFKSKLRASGCTSDSTSIKLSFIYQPILSKVQFNLLR